MRALGKSRQLNAYALHISWRVIPLFLHAAWALGKQAAMSHTDRHETRPGNTHLLHVGVDELVEGVQLLPHQALLLKEGADDCPCILLHIAAGLAGDSPCTTRRNSNHWLQAPSITWVMSAASSRSSSIASAALYMVTQPPGPPAHGYAPTDHPATGRRAHEMSRTKVFPSGTSEVASMQ